MTGDSGPLLIADFKGLLYSLPEKEEELQRGRGAVSDACPIPFWGAYWGSIVVWFTIELYNVTL